MEHNSDNLTRERDALRTENESLKEEKKILEQHLAEAEKNILVLSDANNVADQLLSDRKSEQNYLQAALDESRQENCLLAAQLDIVYLIFGGDRNA